MSGYISLLAGAVAMAYAVAGLFFLRFWVRARDGLDRPPLSDPIGMLGPVDKKGFPGGLGCDSTLSLDRRRCWHEET